MQAYIESFFLIPTSVFMLAFFILGSVLGSFANVLIYRMQQEGPLNLFSRSFCPACKKAIPFYLNVPILSWFFLRGACKNCEVKISFRYPLVEALMACFFTLLFFFIGWKWFLLEALIFCFSLIVVSFIDFDKMILPDSFTLSGILIGFAGAALNPERDIMASLSGAFLGGFVLWFSAYLYFLLRKREGMGGGDLKLLAWIGAVLGWQSIVFVLLTSSILGVVVGGGYMLRSKKNLATPLPFGPYLSLGALCYIFYSHSSLVDFFK